MPFSHFHFLTSLPGLPLPLFLLLHLQKLLLQVHPGLSGHSCDQSKPSISRQSHHHHHPCLGIGQPCVQSRPLISSIYLVASWYNASLPFVFFVFIYQWRMVITIEEIMRLYLCIPVIHFSRVMLKESELKVQILEFRASSLASRPKMDRWGKGRGCKRAWTQHITKTQGATHLILISLNLYQEASFKNAHSLLLRKSFKLDDREKASGRWTSGSMMWGKVSALKFSWFQWEFTFRLVQSSAKTSAEEIYRVGARYVPFVSNDLLASNTAWLLSGAGSLLGKDKSHRQLDFAWVASFDCLQARQLVSSSLMHNRLAASCCSLRLASCLAVWHPVCGSRHTLHILAHGSAGWVGI